MITGGPLARYLGEGRDSALSTLQGDGIPETNHANNQLVHCLDRQPALLLTGFNDPLFSDLTWR